MNDRNPTKLNALLVSDDLLPNPSGSQAVIVEIQADDGTLLLPRLTRAMLSTIQYSTSSDVSFGVNGMLAYDLEGDQLVVFSQGHWKAVLTQDLDLPPPLTLIPAQMNGELPEAYAIAANEAHADLYPVSPVASDVSEQTSSLSIPVTNKVTTAGSRYAVAQPVIADAVTEPVTDSLAKSLADTSSQIQEMTEEQELASLTAQREALQAELSSIQQSLSTLQTKVG